MSTIQPAPAGAPPGARKPAKGKLRLDRGPLRWWLVIVGALTIDFAWPRFVVGSCVVLAGAALHFAVKGYLRQNARLATDGPYRFTRNPFYVANLVAETGLLIVIGRWWVAAVYLLAWSWVYRKTILGEERTLDRLFGDDHRRYREQVPRFFPRPWKVLPRRSGGGSAFSWRNANIVSQRAAERTLRLTSYPLLLLCAAMLWRDGVASLASPFSPAQLAGGGFLLMNLLGALSTVLIRRLSSVVPTSPGPAASPTPTTAAAGA